MRSETKKKLEGMGSLTLSAVIIIGLIIGAAQVVTIVKKSPYYTGVKGTMGTVMDAGSQMAKDGTDLVKSKAKEYRND